jgi:hypothetical protein
MLDHSRLRRLDRLGSAGADLSTAELEGKRTLESLGLPSSKAEVVALGGAKADELKTLSRQQAEAIYESAKERAAKEGLSLATGVTGLSEAQLGALRKQVASAFETAKKFVDLLTSQATQVGWTGSSWDWAGDASLDQLEAVLFQNAKMAENVRTAAEADISQGLDKLSELGQELSGPYSPIIAGFFGIVDQGLKALDSVIYGKGPYAKEEFAAAKKAAKQVWREWKVVPEAYAGYGVQTGEEYKNVEFHVRKMLEDSNTPSWRDRWQAVADWALFTDNTQARDLIRLRWFPFKYSDLAGAGVGSYGIADMSEVYDEPRNADLYRIQIDRIAATIATLVAAKAGVPAPPVIEAAVRVARERTGSAPPGIWRAGNLLRDIFLASEARASEIESAPIFMIAPLVTPLAAPSGITVSGGVL